MNPIDLETARQLIDFSGQDESLKSLAEIQIEGAVALQNMMADPNIGMGYLADEVGMGKTYVALGVVAMLRYFNPMLRVLYICPSRNIQEKWGREYKSFIRTNVRVNQGRIRTREGHPAAPYTSCRNVVDLLHAAASGYYADYFIGKDSFSISLSDDEATWARKRDELKALIPAHEWKGVIRSKNDVKEQYARALNYILPTFDLVVIDEAHNFKHDFESSDRNKVLSGVLGFRESEGFVPRSKNSLLLSATPYDRNLTQLRNQLKLIGRANLLPTEIDDDNQWQVREKLSRFMVRRLNRLRVDNVELTRNMYRREWRKGPKAEITLATDEQKLVTALVQKKVGEMLYRQTESASFQMGLLASFESFAESTRSEPVKFDGDHADKEQSDAKDRHVIGCISDNYKKYGLGRALPHPKMDAVVKRRAHALFEEGKKQLIFVRRVKSVSELKDKLDDAYNIWVKQYIDDVLALNDKERIVLDVVYESYRLSSNKRDDSLLGGELKIEDGSEDKPLPAKNDTFYAWFFRGEVLPEVASQLTVLEGSYPTPEAVRKGLSVRNQVLVNLLEPNWAWYLCRQNGLSLNDVLAQHGENIAKRAAHYISGRLAEDHLDVFQACQIGFIEWMIEADNAAYLTPLLSHLVLTRHEVPVELIDTKRLANQLNISTLYTELEAAGLSDAVVPHQRKLYEALKSESDASAFMKHFNIHKSLMSFLLRTSHGIIDLYMARLKQGAGNLTEDSRCQWMRDFVAILVEHKTKRRFSTYQELTQLASHLELIIKSNIPHILELSRDEYPKFIQRALSPVSPIIGASGETSGSRSSQARKFRMPGYPLALVSTDVFQEGEDLHTFCDSVVHYGLSSSPVSLEQKTGRVDRVGSMAQRRLLALERQAENDEFIQVTFPYVKESIEVLQVRKICKNLNDFIESLHDVTAKASFSNDNVNVSDELKVKEDIPDQIMEKLLSPYTPVPVEQNEYHAIDIINTNETRRDVEIRYVKELIEQKFKSLIDAGVNAKIVLNEFDRPDSTLGVKLGSARSSGELLLSLTRLSEPMGYQVTNRKELIKKIHEVSWYAFHRTIAIECPDAKRCYQLYFNSEMLVGGPEVTQPTEIERIFERMDIQHDPEQYKSELPDNVLACIESINEDTHIPVDRSQETRLHVENINGITTLVFKFGGTQVHRTQRVMLYESDQRCVFISHATAAGFAKNLSPQEIIRHTWIRNRYIDLVGFVIDPSLAIVGRVVHPTDNIDWHEFIYCAYTLAVETDNLEYLLHQQDVH